MTLRGVIQGLLRGSDDAEAMLADEGYGDLPAEMFGQALSSYADTAPMDEADALSPVLTSIDAGDASDVFAVLEEQPPALDASGGPAGLGASVLGINAVDEALAAPETEPIDDVNDFGTAAPDDADALDGDTLDGDTLDGDTLDGAIAESVPSDDIETAGAPEADDPFAADDLFETEAVADAAGEFAEESDFFETEPTATNEDPSDLDF